MDKDSENGSFVLWKMIPPGKTHYFYSFGGEGGFGDAAKD